VGIGSGKDSTAHIYNNRVYNNKIVGIGTRGKSAPWIEHNYIYGNRLGVGGREVSAPHIDGNHIFNNFDGIVISPLSTIKKFAFDDILITNNLVVNNSHAGVMISSFNLSKVIVRGNTIHSNNTANRKVRGGGLILGYPEAGTFTAVVEDNIISHNLGAGIINYTGPENFPQPGVTLQNDRNNLWENTVNYLNCHGGGHAICKDPRLSGIDVQQLANSTEKPVAESSDIGYQPGANDFAELPPEDNIGMEYLKR